MPNATKTNHLKSVIFKIGFPKIPDFSNAKMNEFRLLINEEFPRLQESRSPLLRISVNEDQKPEASSGEKVIWTFLNKNNNKVILLEDSSLSLEYKKCYSSFTEFQKNTELILEAFFTVFADSVSTRLGLRYVNEIELQEENPLDWSKYISNSMTSPLKFFSTDDDLSRYICQIEKNEEDHHLIIKFGIPNSYYPESILKKEFVLDYDYYTLDSLEDKTKILEKFKFFHGKIKELFEKSITPDLKGMLGLE